MAKLLPSPKPPLAKASILFSTIGFVNVVSLCIVLRSGPSFFVIWLRFVIILLGENS